MSSWERCKCKVCDKRFGYFSDQSPMLREDIWKKVVQHYNLEIYELEAGERYDNRVDNKMVDDEHLFICYECMEKALGRKLLKEDLINVGVPFNSQFEKMYFNS